MEGLGSPLYALSWKEWDMALGPPICALRASAPRTSGSGCSSGWPTAASRGWKDTAGMAVEATNPDGSARTRLDQLPRAATLAGWPTARESDGEKNVRSTEGAAREMARKGGPQDLGQGATLAGWPTPVTVPASETSHGQLSGDYRRALAAMFPLDVPVRITANGQTLTGSAAGMESGGQLNPRFSGWLMGYPTAWCLAATRSHKPKRRGKRASGASATPSSLNSPPSS